MDWPHLSSRKHPRCTDGRWQPFDSRVKWRLGGGCRGRDGEVLALVAREIARIHVARGNSASSICGMVSPGTRWRMWACKFPTTKRKSPMQWPHHAGTAVAAAATIAAARSYSKKNLISRREPADITQHRAAVKDSQLAPGSTAYSKRV